MKRTSKIFLRVLLIILGLLVGVLLFMQTPIFKSWIKNVIVTQINKNIRGQLSIESLSGNLFARISLNDVKLVMEEDTLIRINHLTVDYEPRKLLKKEIYIENLVVDHARIFLNQSADTTWNITQLAGEKDEQAEFEEPSDESFPYKIRLNYCQIDSSRILIKAFNGWIPQEIHIHKFGFSGFYGPSEFGLEITTLNLRTVSPELNIDNLTLQFSRANDQYTLKNFLLKTSMNQINLAAESTEIPPQKALLTAETAPMHWEEFEFLLPEMSFSTLPQISMKADFQADSLAMIIGVRDSVLEAVVEIELGQVSSFFNGHGDSLSYTSRLLFKNADVASFYQKIPMEMVLNGVINLSGLGLSKEIAQIDISGNLSRSVLGKRPFSKFKFSAAYQSGNADLELDILGESGEFQAFGHVRNLLETPFYSFNGRVSDFDYSTLFPSDSIQSHLSAEIQAEGHGLTLEDIQANYRISVLPSKIEDFEIDTLFSTGYVEGSQIQLDTLMLEISRVSVHGSGLFDFAGRSDLSYRVSINDLAPFREWLKLETLEGSGFLTGHVTGKFDSLSAKANFEFEDININGNSGKKLKGEGEISVQDDQYWGRNTLSLMQMNLGGTTIDSAQAEASFLQDKIDLELNISLQENVSGRLKSVIQLDSLIVIKLPEFFLNLEELAWQGGGPEAEVIYDDGKMEISGLMISNLSDPKQKIELDAKIDSEGEQDLTLQVTGLDLTVLSPYLALPFTFGGVLNFKLGISGTAISPLIEGKLDISGLKMGEYQYQNFRSFFNYQDSIMVIRGDLNTDQPSILWLEGRLPVYIGLKDFQFEVFRNKPLALQFASDSLKLSMLTPDPAKAQNIQGTLLGNLSVGNTLNHLSVEGFIKLFNASIRMPKYGILYDQIDLNIHAKDSTLYLDKLNIVKNKGILKAEGYLRFSDNLIQGQINSSLLEFDIKDFYAIKHKDFEILIAGDARISGAPDSSKLSGGITIKRSSFYLPAMLELTGKEGLKESQRIPLLIQARTTEDGGKKPDTVIVKGGIPDTDVDRSPSKILNRLSGNLSVLIPRNTWIKGVNWRIELDGNLDLIKEGRDFELFGRIGIVRGDYDFLGKRFKIRQGRLDFKGGREINPEISLEAELELRTGDREKRLMRLFVSGEMKSPVFRFTLDGREITQADAVSYVVTGRSIDELSYGEQAGLEENTIATDLTSGLLSRQLNQQLGQELNVDYMEIKGKDNWQSATFVVGKYLTNELFVSYQREFGDSNDDDIAPETVTVEYEITRNIFLQVIEGDSKARGFDLIFKVDK
ncbi:MAG: translocation/assembly module TamB domain-containing protein [bacterium]|nr:MAG: translocation/assembly module TamB domain-containing protein [bacterium]